MAHAEFHSSSSTWPFTAALHYVHTCAPIMRDETRRPNDLFPILILKPLNNNMHEPPTCICMRELTHTCMHCVQAYAALEVMDTCNLRRHAACTSLVYTNKFTHADVITFTEAATRYTHSRH
jgi:hypothetical protein